MLSTWVISNNLHFVFIVMPHAQNGSKYFKSTESQFDANSDPKEAPQSLVLLSDLESANIFHDCCIVCAYGYRKKRQIYWIFIAQI